MQVLAVALHAPFTQKPLWQLGPDVQADPFPAPTHAPFAHANPLAQAVPQAPQLEGSEAVLSQYVPQSVPVQVSVSPAAPILYSTSRFTSAPVFVAQAEPVRIIDWSGWRPRQRSSRWVRYRTSRPPELAPDPDPWYRP